MSGSIRKQFSDEEVLLAIEAGDGNLVVSAKILSDLRDIDVTHQLLRYWQKQLEENGVVQEVALSATD